MIGSVPYRELNITQGTHRTIYLYFIDQAASVPRPAYTFPTGATFTLKAVLDRLDIDLTKSGTYEADKKRVRIEFTPADFENLYRDERIPFQMIVQMNSKRYALLKGDIFVTYFGQMFD